MEETGNERKKDTEAGKDREIMTNTVGTNNLFCWMCHTVTLLRGKIAFVCPSLYREKWLLQKLFDFPLPFLSSSFKKPKQDFILGPRKIEILSITMVLHFWETSCRYQGCQLWGGGLLWFGDLKGPYHFIKKVIYEAFYPPSTVIPLKHILEFF